MMKPPNGQPNRQYCTHVGTDNGRYDRSWDDNAPNAKAREHKKTVQLVEIMGVSYGQRSDSCIHCQHTTVLPEKARLTGRHHNRRDDQELSIAAPQHAQKPQDNKSSDQDAESNRKTTNTTSDRIVTVHVVRLSGPEEDDGEKVGSGDEGDDECHN